MRRWKYASTICIVAATPALAQEAGPGTTLPALITPQSACTSGVGHQGFAGVVSDMQVGEDGIPKDLTVGLSSGNADLDQAALSCVAGWRYTPKILFGKAVTSDWKAEVVWGDEPGSADRSILRPDIAALSPMLHRLAIDTHMQGPLSTVLKLTQDNAEWRCRQIFFENKDEGELAKHWLAQGWGDSQDLMYAFTNNGHYIAIHTLTDGTFVTAVSIDDASGKGVRLPFARVQELLDHEVAAWNESAKHG